MLHKPLSLGRGSLSLPEFRSSAELLESFVHFLRQQYGVILSRIASIDCTCRDLSYGRSTELYGSGNDVNR